MASGHADHRRLEVYHLSSSDAHGFDILIPLHRVFRLLTQIQIKPAKDLAPVREVLYLAPRLDLYLEELICLLYIGPISRYSLIDADIWARHFRMSGAIFDGVFGLLKLLVFNQMTSWVIAQKACHILAGWQSVCPRSERAGIGISNNRH